MPVLKNAGHVGKIAKRVADANETLPDGMMAP
jgi:hypothetical protein